MLCRIALKNIKKSFRDYAIYFFTLVIGVSVFYVFNAIEDQTTFLIISNDRREMAEMLGTILSGLSIFVAAVLGLLIVYASRFLMKRRNKEFATYLLLGMGKGEIALIMFIETVIIGLVSLFIGLLIGTGLSQLMSAVVANLFEADMSSFKFIVSSGAIVKTILNFAMIYVVVIIFDTFMVGKTRLISLIQSARRGEKVRLKNPALCTVIFIAAAITLGYAYHMVLSRRLGIANMNMKELGIAIALGAVSTFFIFWSISGLLLRIVMLMRRTYFKRLNSFTVRQLSSSINTMVFSMSIICLLLFFTQRVSVEAFREDGINNCYPSSVTREVLQTVLLYFIILASLLGLIDNSHCLSFCQTVLKLCITQHTLLEHERELLVLYEINQRVKVVSVLTIVRIAILSLRLTDVQQTSLNGFVSNTFFFFESDRPHHTLIANVEQKNCDGSQNNV